MNRVLSFLVAIALVLVLAPPAWTADINGKIKSVEGRTITLEDGTRIVAPTTYRFVDQLKPGATVKGAYYEKNGEKFAEWLEVRPGGCPEGPPCPK